jgi:hypothetical protein
MKVARVVKKILKVALELPEHERAEMAEAEAAPRAYSV